MSKNESEEQIMDQLVLDVRGVKKAYGNVQALTGVDLSVRSGVVFGLVGPNGAGKTTLYSIVCGFLRADEGTVRISGKVVTPATPPPRGSVSVLPQDASMPGHVPVAKLLTYYAELGGQTREAAQVDCERVLDLVKLHGLGGRTIDAMSHGQRKRVGIAQAFLGNPRVILLDEPTAGLDPQVAREIRAVLRDLQDGQTILVSSHNLGEIEDLCTEVAILSNGQVVQQDSLASLVGAAAEVSFRMTKPPNSEILSGLAAISFVREAVWDKASSRLRVTFDREATAADEATRDLVGFLVEKQVAFVEMQVGQRLEDRFLQETS